MGLFGKKHKRGHIRDLKIIPPSPAENRHGIAIVTRTLDDDAYFGEWVNFHLCAGVSHFFVYLDGDFDAALSRYKVGLPEGACTFIPWRHEVHDVKSGQRINPQVSAYAHAVQNYGKNFQKFAFIDVDEFLVPKGHANILDALEHTNNHPNVSLAWHMFGYSGMDSLSPLGVVETFTERAGKVVSKDRTYTNFKCIVDPCSTVMVGVHSFKTREHGDATSNCDGFVVSNDERLTDKFATSHHLQLNHYYTKSKSEFAKKIARRSTAGISGKKRIDRTSEIAAAISVGTIVDRSAIEFLDLANKVLGHRN